MFQYAFLRLTARRLGTKFYCPPWIGDCIFSLSDENERIQEPSKNRRQYTEPDYNCGFNPEALHIGDDTEIFGYFQSAKYFTAPRDIQQWFQFIPEISNVKERFSHIDFSHSVSLSLRIGDDYNEQRDLYPLYNLGYYKRALSKVGRKKQVVVFSDNINRAKQYFRTLKSEQLVFIENTKAEEDMYLISQCHDNIIANSTFSWWGAWLNSNPNKTVVSPKEWYRPGHRIGISDVHCPKWIQVSALSPLLAHFRVYKAIKKAKTYLHKITK